MLSFELLSLFTGSLKLIPETMKKYTLFLFVYFLISGMIYAQHSKEIMYVGTYSTRGSEGIYVLEFDRARGKLKLVQTIQTLESPNFLAIHPSGNFLYSVNSGSLEDMKNSGSVSAFSIDKRTGKLTALNQRPSYGSGPCHISIDKTGKWAFIANYSEGNFVVLPIFDDGLLGSSSDSRKHLGSSVNPERQTKPYVHSAFVSPDNRFVIVSDLGTDKIYSYKLDVSDGRIIDGEKPFVSVKPGCGPRHFTFHPNGKFGYSAEEMTSTVGAFAYDKEKGSLTVIQDSVVSLPATFTGKNTAADIHTDPKGNFLYVSNRGLNALSIFKINKDGTLQLIGQQDTKGKLPRNFLVDSRGEYVFVANQETDNIVIFRLDQKTGKLKYTGNQFKVPSPVCLKMTTFK